MSVNIKSTLKWNGTTAIKDLDSANFKALTESAILVENKAVTTVHVDTGALKGSIKRDVEKTTAYIGTNLEYAPFEELGTRFRPPHPYLRPAFYSSIKAIEAIFMKWYKAVKYVS